MESQNEHLSLLIDLLPKYRQLNSLYQRIAEDYVFKFDEQCRITDFYNEFKNEQAFEKAVLNLLLSTDKEKQEQIVANLRTEINKNIDLYATNKDLFSGIDTLRICTQRRDPIRIKIENKQKDANKLWQELTHVRNSLESASWNDDKIATERLTREEERLDVLYKQEQKTLETLYKLQKESDIHAFQYIDNQFENIYKLGCSFIFLLNNYYPIEKGKTPESVVADTEIISEPELQTAVEPDMIFRTGKYEKFLSLESKLISNKYLNAELRWISIHENGKPDIKRLITFLVALLDNRYFLPGKDPKIKTFFESRYQIALGQNFERKRRESLLDNYKAIFYNYDF